MPTAAPPDDDDGKRNRRKRGDAARRHRQATAARSRAHFREISEIGPLPKIANPTRRRRCAKSLRQCLLTYLAHNFTSPFSPDHDSFIARVENAMIRGGRELRAVFRGFGKSTILEGAIIWGIVYGIVHYAVLLGADRDAANASLESIKAELESNDDLAADFPEICHPIRALEGRSQRCATQTLDGQLTHLQWTKKQVVVATVPGSKSSGAIIETKGFLSCRRGMKHKTHDGRTIRPDCVLVDDPQTDRSARSPGQVVQRIEKLYRTIFRLAGHEKPVAVFIAGTVIQPGDMIAQLLDRENHGSIRADRCQMVLTWPNALDSFWLGPYAETRRNFDVDDPADRDRAAARATRLYKRQRKMADAGARVAWDHCYSKTAGEISAIQHAINILIDDGPEAFAAECQNEPVAQAQENAYQVDARILIKRTTGAEPRGQAPQRFDQLTAFVDVQQTILYWMIAAWRSETFDGQVVDWGTFPDQQMIYFALSQARARLSKRYPDADTEGRIFAGIVDLAADLFGRGFHLGMMLVDSAKWSQTVYDAVAAARRQLPGANIVASRGRGVRAKDRQISDWNPKPGSRIGREWIISKAANRPGGTLLTYDANYWKQQAVDALRLQPGSSGAILLPDCSVAERRMPVDHFASERGTLVKAPDRQAVEFSLMPGQENHLFDCLVGNQVAASVLGAIRPGQSAIARPERRRPPVRYF